MVPDPGAGAGTESVSVQRTSGKGMADELLSDEGADWGDLDAGYSSVESLMLLQHRRPRLMRLPLSPAASAQQPQATLPSCPRSQRTTQEPRYELQPTAEPAVGLSAQRSTLRTTLAAVIRSERGNG